MSRTTGGKTRSSRRPLRRHARARDRHPGPVDHLLLALIAAVVFFAFIIGAWVLPAGAWVR